MRSFILLLAMFALFSGGLSVLPKTLCAGEVSAATSSSANAQEGPKASDPKPVILKVESYEELYKIEDQIKQAAREEQEAFNVYKGREATRLALQQAFESARLRALMALGITNPNTPIAPPPEEKPEKPKP